MIVKAGDVDFNVLVDGSEEKPWLILSNSLGSDLSMWDPQISFLTNAYRILRYDTRGHGKSTVTSGPYSFELLSNDVINIMDKLEICTASFMGLSMGGMTGLGLGINFPSRFVRIICAAARADTTNELRKIWNDRNFQIKDKGLLSITQSTLDNWISKETQIHKPEISDYIKNMITSHDPYGYIANCDALKNLNYFDRLKEIRVPVLYIGGSEDFVAPPSVMQKMSLQTSYSEYIKIQGGFHLLNIDKTIEFNNRISKFLAL